PIPLGWSSHFDVREALEGDDKRRRGSLDYFCAVFGVTSPKIEMDGSLVGQAYEEGRIEDIERYCLADCRATLDLYRRLRPFYGAGRA
ncbi:MAG: ribonuclease H-like domain-containing protein, partial [Vicinamibacteria bacterium]